MNSRDRFLVTLAIIALIAAALLTSFGRSFFSNHIPSVVLPNISDSSDLQHPDTDWFITSDSNLPVTVTTDTVQEVVRSLNRTESYYSEQQVTLFWADTSTTTNVSVWKHLDWTSIEQSLPNESVRYDLVSNDAHYYWYDNARTYLTVPLDASSADLSQHIPTYEDIADIPSDTITKAEYVLYLDTTPCIYVEVTPDDQTVERYWISTSSGLLICAETECDGTLIYQLKADSSIQSPCPSLTPFVLPDGTELIEAPPPLDPQAP